MTDTCKPKLKLLLETFNKMESPIFVVSFDDSYNLAATDQSVFKAGCCGKKVKIATEDDVAAAQNAMLLMDKYCVDLSCPPIIGLKASAAEHLVGLFSADADLDSSSISFANLLRKECDEVCCDEVL